MIETLRIEATHVGLLAGPAVPRRHIEHAPVGVALACGRIEGQVAHRVNGVQQLHPHHLPHGAFEGRVPDVAVGPFTQHALTRDGLTIGGHANWLRGNKPRRVETRQHTGLRLRVNRRRRVFEMDRVEHAVAPVIRIEGEAHQPTDKSAAGGEPWKQPWRIGGPVEVDVRDGLPSGLVDDGERSRVFGDEQPRTAWLFDEDIDSRRHGSTLAASGARHFDVVREFRHERRRGRLSNRQNARATEHGAECQRPCRVHERRLLGTQWHFLPIPR